MTPNRKNDLSTISLNTCEKKGLNKQLHNQDDMQESLKISHVESQFWDVLVCTLQDWTPRCPCSSFKDRQEE